MRNLSVVNDPEMVYNIIKYNNTIPNDKVNEVDEYSFNVLQQQQSQILLLSNIANNNKMNNETINAIITYKFVLLSIENESSSELILL